MYCIILFLKQAISPQHLHRMDIRLETTELSGVLAFDHERDKKTHTCQCYFIINSS